MGVLAKFPATPGQFVKDNTTDLVNLILGWAVFWCYGFRLIYTCGYTTTRTMSRYYCEQFYQALTEQPDSACSISLADGLPTWTEQCEAQFMETPAFNEVYTVDLYRTCAGPRTGGEEVYGVYGSLSPLGQTCSGTNGSGEFIVTLLLMTLVTVVFFWKMAKFVHCPDKLERKRRKEVMLKDFLLSQNSTSD